MDIDENWVKMTTKCNPHFDKNGLQIKCTQGMTHE